MAAIAARIAQADNDKKFEKAVNEYFPLSVKAPPKRKKKLWWHRRPGDED